MSFNLLRISTILIIFCALTYNVVVHANSESIDVSIKKYTSQKLKRIPDHKPNLRRLKGTVLESAKANIARNRAQLANIFKKLVDADILLTSSDEGDQKLFDALWARRSAWDIHGANAVLFFARQVGQIAQETTYDFLLANLDGLLTPAHINDALTLVCRLFNEARKSHPAAPLLMKILAKKNLYDLIAHISRPKTIIDISDPQEALLEYVLSAQGNEKWISKVLLLSDLMNKRYVALRTENDGDKVNGIQSKIRRDYLGKYVINPLRDSFIENSEEQTAVSLVTHLRGEKYELLEDLDMVMIYEIIDEIVSCIAKTKLDIDQRIAVFTKLDWLFGSAFQLNSLDRKRNYFKRIKYKYLKIIDAIKKSGHGDSLPFFASLLYDREIDDSSNGIDMELGDSFLTISQQIFSDLPKKKSGLRRPDEYYPVKVLFNNDGFPAENMLMFCHDGCVQTKPLTLKPDVYFVNDKRIVINKEVPIGYNIHFPPADIKAIVVIVYGGSKKSKINKEIFRPLSLDNFFFSLLAQGIAVATVNLADHLELGPEGQDAMPEDLHSKIHLSIHRIFQAFKITPEELFSKQEADKIRSKKIFLFGQSFGGMLSVRHAELFPETFDGFISHDGGLSYEVGTKAETGVYRNEYRQRSLSKSEIAARAWLSPMSEPWAWRSPDPKIQKIMRPVLLLHNFDDNNVNVLVSIKWYERAMLSDKDHLIGLYVTQEGYRSGRTDFYNKAHYIPTKKNEFAQYFAAVTSFIENNGQNPANLYRSRLHAHDFGLYAYKNNYSSSLEERFLSYGFRHLMVSHPETHEGYFFHSSWELFREDQGVDLAKIYFALFHLEKRKNIKGELARELSSMSSFMKDERKLAAFKSHLPDLVDFFHEVRWLPRHLVFEMLNQPSAFNAYKNMLAESSLNDELVVYLLFHIYMSNPTYLQVIKDEYEGNSEAMRGYRRAVQVLIERLQYREGLIGGS